MQSQSLFDDEAAALAGAATPEPQLPRRGAELTVVVPTFNERDNIEPLLARLDAALCGIDWEVVFVDDDSPDGTAEIVRALAERMRESVVYSGLAAAACRPRSSRECLRVAPLISR